MLITVILKLLNTKYLLATWFVLYYSQPMETITYEDFKKLDIRVGTIKQAEKIEKSEKLLKLMIDTGDEDLRQIVSGIAEYYTPKALVGRQLLVLVNLEPKELMGVESRGMILAANDNSSPVWVSPEKFVEEGVSIS